MHTEITIPQESPETRNFYGKQEKGTTTRKTREWNKMIIFNGILVKDGQQGHHFG